MVRYEISGTEKFRVTAAKLRIAEKDLPRELRSAVDKGAKPLPAAGRRSALENLPHRGGLNVLIASARFTIRRLSGSTLEIQANGIEQLELTNRGRVNHPTYGRRPRVTQAIPRARSWFFKPMRRSKAKIRHELGDALHREARKIT